MQQNNPTRNNNSQDNHKDREGLIYVRVSSKKQELEGNGLDSQEKRCKEKLESLGITKYKTFSDVYSGGGDFMNRPAMRDLIRYSDIHYNKKFILIFDDLKRFARDTEFHLKLRTVLKDRNIIPICLNFNFNESPEGRFAETVLAAGSELERHQNKRQVIQKMKVRMEAGYWAFGSKKGYKIIRNPVHGKICVPDKKYSNLLKIALENFSKGIFQTKIDACKFLVENGFWNKNTPEKYICTFTKFLEDPFYAGFIEYEKWEISRRIGYHSPIISLETFELNKARLNKNSPIKKAKNTISDDFPLRGLIVCDKCNGHLSASWSKGRSKKYGFYFCQNNKCELYRKSFNSNLVYSRFLSTIEKIRLKENVSDLIDIVFDRVWKEEISYLKEIESGKRKKLSTLDKKISDLTEIIIKTKSETLKNTYENELEKASLELKEIRETINNNIDYDIPYQTALNKSKDFLKSPYNSWNKVDTEEKHRLYFFLFDEKLPYSQIEGYRTDKIPSIIKSFEEFVYTDSNDVDPSGFEPLTSGVQNRRSTK